ncbi:hypothetical protein HEP81_06722 [Streptomyces griseofuscus]|uniref:Uncharacterized protein n=1 Tax=Streptomyces griseofuscus TaxID=146922 RepID=A0A7H1Q9H6_9ACTN|nr:hypothetical protein HEP81_06722 [Streptomyces griseofuscus]BBC97552.1 hypothetical protein SRO_6376 [Streptomyces rochei]
MYTHPGTTWGLPISPRTDQCAVQPRHAVRDDELPKNDEDGEETVLHATRMTLGLPARRIGQLTDQIRGRP